MRHDHERAVSDANYDGQGKTAAQEAEDSIYVLVYVFVGILMLFVVAVIVLAAITIGNIL